MQILISIMLVIGIFPIINLLCRAYSLNDITSIMMLISYIVQSVIDTLTTFMVFKNIRGKNKRTIQSLIILLCGVVLGMISAIFINRVSIIVWIISSVMLSMIVERVFFVDIQKISNTYVFLIVCFIYVLITFMGWQSGIETFRTFNIILFVIFCVIFAIIKNRIRLDNLILRRSKNLDSLPKDIYNYNRKLTLILCIIPLPLLIFVNKIGTSIYNLMISLLRGVVNIFIFFSSLFKKDNSFIEDVSSQEPMSPYVRNSNSIFGDVATIISIVLIFFFIYYYHENIIATIKGILCDIKNLFTAINSKTKSEVLQIKSSEEYTDYITDTPNVRYSKKIFKKDYKSYLKMDNSIDTFKFGYSILIYGLNILGYDIKSFENVTEISNKLDFSNSKELSKIYLSIRYNDTLPSSNDKIILNDVLKQISKKI